MRDEGLSGYHQRHVTHGALGVFLRAVESGVIDAGSVLIVEGLDRLSRAEPLKAQAQLTQIIHAGLVVVTAADGQEYSLDSIKANPYKLIHSLVVMIRAHEESDTKSKRVRAAIRRQCEGWLAGSWRGAIRNGKDPHWVRWDGSAFELVPERAEALRYAVSRFMDGLGAVQVMRELDACGMTLTESGKLSAPHFYKTLSKRLLVGERMITVGGETYRLAGYYPALLTDAEFDALQVAVERRHGKRGVGEIPSILTGMGICVCGYCGAAVASQNMMGRKRQADGRPQPSHRRLHCVSHNSGKGCTVGGSIQAAPVERALILFASDRMRMASLNDGRDATQTLRADLALQRGVLAGIEPRLERLTHALADDTGPAPLIVLRQIRTLEAEAEAARHAIASIEREISTQRQPPTPDNARRWLALIDAIDALDVEARLQAREMVRESFSKIVLWHSQDDGRCFELELTARGGGAMRMKFDRETGWVVRNAQL